MDEPETHLHPNLISDFVNLLDFILENTGSQAILATHSAYFVREIPKEQVHVFQMHSENTISIENPRLNTFGATVDSISQFVFLEDSEVELTEKIISKIGNRIFEDIEEELSKHISLAALMNIRRRIEKI
jgi:energy-coupling factor transporter ATP-binding protein EcfA2